MYHLPHRSPAPVKNPRDRASVAIAQRPDTNVIVIGLRQPVSILIGHHSSPYRGFQVCRGAIRREIFSGSLLAAVEGKLAIAALETGLLPGPGPEAAAAGWPRTSSARAAVRSLSGHLRITICGVPSQRIPHLLREVLI